MLQKQMEKIEKDTYAVRRAEGRPKHGQTSFTILGVGIITWFALLIALAIPEWRSNWIGMLGYPHKRSWGLFSVSGMHSKMHHEMMTDACRYYSQLTVAGVCASPICLWYRTKCQVYMDMAMVNYSTGFFFFIALILHTLCLIWTTRMTPRMIRWAAIWWTATVVLHACVLTFWFMMITESFSSLDALSLYPQPDVSFCFYLECLVIMGLCINATLGFTLMKMWPESSSDESTDDSDETDEDSDEAEGDGVPAKKAMPEGKYITPPPSGMGGGPMPGWDPSMGGAPQMGYPGGPMMGQQGAPMMAQYPDPGFTGPAPGAIPPGIDPSMVMGGQPTPQPGFGMPPAGYGGPQMANF